MKYTFLVVLCVFASDVACHGIHKYFRHLDFRSLQVLYYYIYGYVFGWILAAEFFVDDTLVFGCYGCLDFKVTDKRVLNQSKFFLLIT